MIFVFVLLLNLLYDNYYMSMLQKSLVSYSIGIWHGGVANIYIYIYICNQYGADKVLKYITVYGAINILAIMFIVMKDICNWAGTNPS